MDEETSKIDHQRQTKAAVFNGFTLYANFLICHTETELFVTLDCRLRRTLSHVDKMTPISDARVQVKWLLLSATKLQVFYMVTAIFDFFIRNHRAK